MKKSFQRERRFVCGPSKASAEYQEVYIYPMTDSKAGRDYDREVTRPRRATTKAMADANARRARRHLVQLINTNFDEHDVHTTLTYKDELLPADDAQAERDLDNFVRHLAAKCKKQGLPGPEYVAVTEGQTADSESGAKAVRYHHHIVLKCGLTRDEIEQCWNRNRVKLGYANADRLQLDKGSAERLALYITKAAHHKRRWKQSRGLRQPIMPRPNDSKYSRRKVERLAKDAALLHDADFWEAKYPGWLLNEAQAVYNDYTGWSIILKMRRKRYERMAD